MAGSFIGFQTTGPRNWERSRPSTPAPAKVQLVLTWEDGGYEVALEQAKRFARRGEIPVFIKLASQPSPRDDFSKEIYSRGWKLLSVANRFGDGDQRANGAFLQAVAESLRQHDEGWIEYARRPAAAAVPPAVPALPTTARNLTEDEIREFLAAVYGNTDDDGVR